MLLVGLVFSGCIGTDDENNDESDNVDNDVDGNDGKMTGTANYSGTWSGSIGGESYSGTWEFDVDFDEGTVTGSFSGDGTGDITGTVSDREIQASGNAAFGTVEWSGDFTSNGEEVSGTWELAGDYAYSGSGTWSGELGEIENGNDGDNEDNGDENGLPDEDQVDGDEPIARYPDSIMLEHSNFTSEEGQIIEINYGTTDSLDDVVAWYKQELGGPNAEESEDGETTLHYMFEEEEYAKITVSTDEYTLIELRYGVSEG